ncbi:VRR-NUC domain-containing protein [Marinobacter daqiaonensis]|uniref:phosphodiesterase I n=1 Tax=Marinobacter daqiaonensis TaxID=650891 RepID=A0A1I6I5G7_9GAMM|nr:VRR-NUC domain-containing protein [Marinobacter daqiaonensis]SFR61986.1 VRR-NUC domain-containing protein [Marinobacter daqiaonensis]
MTDSHPQARPQTADLADPLYYLANMETVVTWVAGHHADLLTQDECDRLAAFGNLSVSARALLTRMVMRTGELFRLDKFKYPELPDSEARALMELGTRGWLEDNPELTLDDLFRLFTLAELRPAFAATLKSLGHPSGLPKGRMKALLAGEFPDPRPVSKWLGHDRHPVVRLRYMALFDRVRLMFFGNLRQSWSDFVLVELGYQQYETVPLSPRSRAFHDRGDVDCYLVMHQCREQLDAGVAAPDVWGQVPDPADNAWLASRRDRLLLELGRQAERQGEPELALEALAGSHHREARLKQLRLLERMKRFDEAWAIARNWHDQDLSDAEAQGLGRLLKRLSKKVGEPAPPLDDTPVPETFTLILPEPGPVEWLVQQHLTTDECPVVYVENTLINGLFGLLCWEVIFTPMPGAFFHPFHVGPADLTREDFVSRRRDLLEACFRQLDTDAYRDTILTTWRRKQGLANPFVHWQVLSGPLLEMALHCIPPVHLKVLFRRLLANLKEHRSGFPDLIRFVPDHPEPAQRYEMIEVKGPGDRLQDHQRRWLAFFDRQGIAARVCHVRWQEPEFGP